LRKDSAGFFLFSRAPVKILRLNESLFDLLEHIRDGVDLADFHTANPQDTMKVLLTLVARGYLKLDRIAPLTEYPFVSVIVPVRDRPDDLIDCLKAPEKVRYPVFPSPIFAYPMPYA